MKQEIFSQLPKYTNTYLKSSEDLEAVKKRYTDMGIDIVNDRDSLSWNARLPEGWMEKGDGGYWINVYDERGKLRFSYFVKQCIYEYDTFVSFEKE